MGGFMRRLLLIFTIFQVFAAVAVADEPTLDGWKFYAVRQEIAPKSGILFDKSGNYRLTLAGSGNESVDGHWLKRVAVTAGKYVVFNARYKSDNVATPVRSIVSSIIWFDERGKQVEQAEFPMMVAESDGAARMIGTYQVPPKVTSAEIQLRLRWAANGEVQFSKIELKETSPPAPRNVKIASINHRPRNSKSSQTNLEQFSKLI